MRQGVLPEDVMCKETLELVIRINGLAACVKPENCSKDAKNKHVVQVSKIHRHK